MGLPTTKSRIPHQRRCALGLANHQPLLGLLVDYQSKAWTTVFLSRMGPINLTAS